MLWQRETKSSAERVSGVKSAERVEFSTLAKFQTGELQAFHLRRVSFDCRLPSDA